MSSFDYVTKARPVRVTLDATAIRTPGHRGQWTVERGHWRATATTEKEASDRLADGVAAFLAEYRPPMVFTFGGHTLVLSVEIGDDTNPVVWRMVSAGPDGKGATCIFGAAGWREAEASARHNLAQRVTDWHDDDSVRRGATYLTGDDESPYGPEDFYRYAAWQRAANAAMDAGSPNWHEWAGQHWHDFSVPRD